MSFFAFLILIVVFFTFRSTVLSVKRDAEDAIQHIGKSMVAGSVHLRAQVPAVTDEELQKLMHQELQLKKLEKLEAMSEEELLKFFKSEAKVKK